MKMKKTFKSHDKSLEKQRVGDVINDLTLNLREYLSALQAVTVKKPLTEK